tara:strand:- start:83 stop:418 length:336 start_codon:yes stop_codon:yes gene_type:complete
MSKDLTGRTSKLPQDPSTPILDDEGYYVGSVEEVQNNLYDITSHKYSQEEYDEWEEKLLKRARKLSPQEQLKGFTPEAWYNWLVNKGLDNDDLLNDLSRFYGDWTGKEVIN